MLNSLDDLSQLLVGTAFEGVSSASLEIPDCPHSALAIEVNPKNAIAAWKLMRSLLDRTQRWPVDVGSFDIRETDTWEEGLVRADYFHRPSFEWEYYRKKGDNVSPQALINGSRDIDIEKEFDRIALREYEDLDEYVYSQIEGIFWDLEDSDDSIPDLSEYAPFRSRLEFEKWLFAWECDRLEAGKKLEPPDLTYQSWFEGESALLLLPTPHSWETLAYLNWFGAQFASSEFCIALLHSWHQQFGAELVAHFGTMLQFFVAHPPTTLEIAVRLAVEHDIIAPCTTAKPGVSLREHARSLLHLDRWFLHERP